MSPSVRIFCLIGIASALGASSLAAQPLDGLEAAEQAYRDVNFQAQRDEALRALEAGNNDRARLAQLYRLLGIAHAALDERALAKECFLRLLALEPEVELERALSPRLRSSYLEARGFWDVTPARLGVDVLSRGPQREMRLRVRDPIGMVARVRVSSLGTSRDVVVETETSQEVIVTASELGPHSASALAIQLLDVHGNVLVARALSRVPTPSAAAAQPGVWLESRRTPKEAPPAKVDPASLIVAGAGVLTLGFGVYQHVVRENAAFEWNGAACERSGFGTRGAQCAEVDSDRRSAERLAVASYSAGGALLITGLVMHLVAGGPNDEGRRERAQAVACNAGPGPLGLACSTAW